MHQRLNSALLTVAGILAVVGGLGVLWMGEDHGPATAEDLAFDKLVTTTRPTSDVLGAQVDNTTTTTTTQAVVAAATTTTADPTTSTTTTTVTGRRGRLYGTLSPTDANGTTIVRLLRGDAVVNETETDPAGKWQFSTVAPGTYTLERTTTAAPDCAPATTSSTACVSASSQGRTAVELKPGEEREVSSF